MAIRRVWIEEGCISCNICEDTCPSVFYVAPGESSETRKGYEKLLDDDQLQEDLQEAADSCPVEVIQLAKDDEPPTPAE